MSFVVRKPGAGAVALGDLGITVTGLAASERDLRDIEAADIALSADLAAAISGARLIVGQDETSYDNTPVSEGVFVGGSGFVSSPGADDGATITLSDGSVITIDNVTAGVVDQFTVSQIGTSVLTAAATISQSATTGAGTGFTLTPDADNLTAVALIILDPRDDTTALSVADGELARVNANDSHFGISGGRFSTLDDPATAITDQFLVKFDAGTSEYVSSPFSAVVDTDVIGQIIGAMGVDGTDTTFAFNGANTFLIAGVDETSYDGVEPNGTFNGIAGAGSYVIGDVITLSDGSTVTVDAVSTGDVTQFTVTTSGGTPVTAGVALTQVSVVTDTGQTGFTLTPESLNAQAGTLQWNTDDAFLRNTGDTLDSGTLTVASGATIAIATGGDLTIADLPTNPQDAANKEYVDSVASGLDPKESVRYCSELDVGGTYVPAGGAGGTGNFTGVDLTSAAIFDGLTAGAIIVGDRLLIKSQISTAGFADALVNGAPAGAAVPAIATNIYDLDVTFETGGLQQLAVTVNVADDYDTIAATISGLLTNGTCAFVAGAFRVTSALIGATSTALIVEGTGGPSAGGGFIAAVDAAAGGATTFPAPTVGTNGGLENGIYVVTTAGAAGVIERATDHDGSPTNEVSGGNFTFVENGTTCENTGWVLQGDGILTLNVDNIIFVQFSESTNIQPGVGISQGGPDFDLDIATTLGTGSAVASTDLIAFHDQDGTPAGSGSGSQTYARSFDDVFNDLDVVTHSGGNGILVKTGNDTYTNRSIAVNGAGPLDGLAVTNGDGVAGNPTVGLDIQNLPLRAAVDATNDRVAVWDSSVGANVYYSISDIATAGSAVNSFETWLGAGNTSGDASIVADSATDTVTLTGGIGININLAAISDTLTLSFTRAGMADTAVTSADTIPFFDATNANEPEFRSFADIINDLGIATLAFTTISGDTGSAIADTASDTLNLVGAANGGITTVATDAPETVTFGITPIDLTTGSATLTTGDFIVVSDSADTATTLALKYTFTDVIADLGLAANIVASTNEDELGIVITGTNTIGFTIDTLSNPAEDMAATDEFAVHNKSEGTGGANRKMTGQDVADGVANILNIATLTFDVFPAVVTPADDQTLLAYTDTDRAKVLSVESHTYVFSDNSVDDGDWLDIGNASDTLTGYIMPLDGTVVSATAHTEDANGNTYDIDLFVDAVDSGPIANLTGAGEAEDTDPTLSLDFAAGQKLRLQADRSAGTSKLGDTVVVLTVRWRS